MAKRKMGRPADPLRDLIIYMLVASARNKVRPKHPGLEPVPLSWDKAYEVVQWELASIPTWPGSVNLSIGAIRAAYSRAKRFAKPIKEMLSRSDYPGNPRPKKSAKKS